MPTKRESRSGPTQPEDRRVNMQVKLRLHPSVVARLRALAAADGLEVSAYVTRWVEAQ